MPKRGFVLVDIWSGGAGEWLLAAAERVSYLDPVLRFQDTPDRIEFRQVRMKPGALYFGNTLSGLRMIAFPGRWRKEKS
jgi:hypothetical protein